MSLHAPHGEGLAGDGGVCSHACIEVVELTGTDLIWTVNFNQDVDGTSPVVGTGFVDGAKALSTALEASWQNTWSLKLDYTNFFGDGNDTLGNELGDHVLGDRDNISIAVKYRF